MTFAARPLWALVTDFNATVLAGAVFGTGAVGNVFPDVSESVAVTGVSASGAVNSVLVDSGNISFAVNGVGASTAVGVATVIAGNTAFTVTGLSATGAIGSPIVSNNVDFSVIGVNATTSVGNENVDTTTVASPIGAVAVGVVGNVIPITGFTSYTNPIGFDGGYFGAQQYSGDQAGVYLLVSTNGAWSITLNGWDIEESTYTGNWGNPTATGSGDSLYYRYILNSAFVSGGTGLSTYEPYVGVPRPYTSPWVQGTGGGNAIIILVTSQAAQASSSSSANTNYTIQISTAADISGLVAQGTLTMSTFSSFNNPP